jgi:hypothetical protein
MHLPDLGLQIIYGRLAWGIVLAALIVALWPRRFALSRTAVAILTLGMIALQALPGTASPTFQLALAFQVPSCLLVGLCLAQLYLSGPERAVIMPPRLAMLLAATGAVLYLDAMGLISVGLYYWGFGPNAAPVAAVLLAMGAALALALGKARPQAFALLLAMMSFSILRLSTGNIWDALLDPLLWCWALCALVLNALKNINTKEQAQ